MSWLFSQALVEEYLGASCSDVEQCAPLNAMLTPQQFWRNDKMMDCSKPSLFGLTLQHLTDDRGEALLKSCRAVFLARTYPVQEKAQESPGNEADYGKSLPALLAKYDPDLCLWKTAQCSLFEDSESSLETFPRWGLMRNGALYLRETAALRMKGSESGLWLTPRASDVGKGEGNHTFLARMGDRTDKCAQSLAAQVNNPQTWPTPLSCSAMGATITPESAWNQDRFPNLKTMVGRITWPTPTAHNAKEGAYPAEYERNMPTLAAQAGGALNPMWVEWLMGWPLGWTDLKPLAMDKFQSWQQQHSGFYQEQQSND